MSFFAAASLASFVAALLLGVAVVSLGFHRALNRVFFLLCCAVAGGALVEFGYRTSATYEQALSWWRLDVTWPLIPSFLLHFSLLFRRGEQPVPRLLLAGIYAPAVLFLGLKLANMGISAPPELMWWGYTFGIPHERFWADAFFVWSTGAGLASAALCAWLAVETPSRWRKRQASLIALGVFFPYLASILSGYTLRSLYGRHPEIAYSIFVISAALIGFAIWKYHAFELTPRRAMDTILGTMPDAVFLTDAHGEITTANPAAAGMLGYALNDLVGLPLRHVMPELEAIPNAAPNAAGESGGADSPRRHDTHLLTRQGQELPVDVMWTHLTDPAGHALGAVYVAHDITRRKRNETQLARQRDHLERLVAQRTSERDASNAQLQHAQKMEAMGQLAGGVAHDFNNLLTAILGNLSLAQLEDSVRDARPYLEEANKAGLRAAGLIRQLLAFSRKSQIVIQAVDIGPVFEEIESIVRQTFDRRIEVEFTCPPNLPKVRADAGQIHQVLLNLCVNARDALDEVRRRHKTPVLRITVRAEAVHLDAAGPEGRNPVKPGEYLCISVSDTGAGISPHVRERIFEPFFTTKGAGKGTGLGLATAYGIVDRHGGWIEIESEIGIGSTFLVHFPICAAPADADMPRSTQLELLGGTESILLVDDERPIRAVGKTILERLGYSVTLAADGRQCLHTLFDKGAEVDLVILDLSMPGLSGYEVLAEIRRRGARIPVIISSGYTEHTLEPELEAIGAAAFIGKPFSIDALAMSIRKVLDAQSDRTRVASST